MNRSGVPIIFHLNYKDQLESDVRMILNHNNPDLKRVYISSLKIMEIDSEAIIFGMYKHYGRFIMTWKHYLANKQCFLTSKN